VYFASELPFDLLNILLVLRRIDADVNAPEFVGNLLLGSFIDGCNDVIVVLPEAEPKGYE